MRQTYLPRLRTDVRGELGHTVISKTYKTYILPNQIEELGAAEVLSRLKESCLENVDGDFVIENVLCNPTVVGFKS